MIKNKCSQTNNTARDRVTVAVTVLGFIIKDAVFDNQMVVDIVEDEYSPFTSVTQRFGDLWFCHHTCHRTSEECSVVDASHVVAGAAEAKCYPEYQHSRISPSRDFQTPQVDYIRRENWASYSMIIVMNRSIKKNQS